MNDELEMILEERGRGLIEALYRHVPGGIDKNNEKPRSV
jgi:hypothetical protein